MLTRRAFAFAAGLLPASAAEPPFTVRAKRKPSDEWKSFPTRTLTTLPNFKPGNTPLGAYGGRADRKAAARGFFRAELRNGRWWFIDPDGCLYLNCGVCSVTRGRSRNNQTALAEKYGTPERWADETARLLRDNFFSAAGGWSDVELLRGRRIVYTVSSNFMSGFGRERKITYQQPGHMGYPQDVIPVFHPEFEPFCERYAQALAAYKDDPWLLGHFSDNELPAPADLLDRCLKLNHQDPHSGHAVEAAKKWLAARKGGQGEINAGDRDAFRGFVYERYFAATTRAIRKHDPRHLCLGPRLHGSSLRSPAIFAAAGKHLDAIAVNVYGQWGPERELMEMWVRESKLPFMVTEFYAKGDDSGFKNTTGAGWLVPTQADRAAFYQHFVLGLLESKGCAGWHWFKYMDNDPEDLSTDPSNRDSNKGIVGIRYEPYRPLLEGMRAFNAQIYRLADFFDL